jgi:hypothetical protein
MTGVPQEERTLTITGIVYLNGSMPRVGSAVDESGMRLNVIFRVKQRVSLLDTIEATGEMVTSPEHCGRPAFAIETVHAARSGTLGSLRRLLKAAQRNRRG